MHKLKGFVLSPLFQCALQLTVGIFIICLFTFVSKMRFLQSCLSATLYVVCSVLVSQDGHVGTKLLGCAMVCGAVLWGSTLAGCVLSFALVVGEPGTSGHSAFLCCMSAAVLAVLVVNRMGANPPFLWVAVGIFQLTMALGAGTAAVIGVVVLPSLAADEMRERVAEAMEGTGAAVARYASMAFKPEADPKSAAATVRRGPGYHGGGSKHSKAQQRPLPAAASLLLSDATAGGGGYAAMGAGVAVAVAARDAAVAAVAVAGGVTPDISSSSRALGSAGGPGSAEGVADVEDLLLDDIGKDFNDDDYLQLLRDMTEPPHQPPHQPPGQPLPALPRKVTAISALDASSKHGVPGGGASGGGCQHAKAAAGGIDSGKLPPAEPEDVEMAAAIEDAAAAAARSNAAGASVHGGSSEKPQLVAALRPLLARARMCIGAASLEPPLFLAAPINPPAWGRVVGAAEELLTRVAALEGLVGDGCGLQVMADASLTCYFEVDIVPYFRRVHAHVAATCATLADAIRHRARGGDQAARHRGSPQLFTCSGWQQTKAELRQVLEWEFGAYWDRARAAAARGNSAGKQQDGQPCGQPGGQQDGQQDEAAGEQPVLRLAEVHQMRGIAFMWTLTNSLIDAMEGLERAVAAAHGIAMPPPTPAPAQQAPPAGHQQQNPAGEGGAVAVAVAPAPAAGGGSGGQALAEGVEGGYEEAPKPAAAAAAASSTPPGPPPPGLPPPPTWFQHNFGWAVQLTLVALGLPLVTSLVHTLGAELSALRRGEGWKALLRSRVFQAGAKYWACLVTVLLLILGLSERGDTGYVAAYRLAYAYEAAALAMTERVEATVSQVSLWVVGTAVGGTLGYLAMLDPDLATNPYGLMAIICTYTFLVGCASSSAYRMGIVFTLMAMASLILCQYRGCCDATGSVELYAARVLMVMTGYTSDWALDVMGSSFLAACRLVRSYYASYYNDGLRAYTAVHGEAAAATVCAAHGAPFHPLNHDHHGHNHSATVAASSPQPLASQGASHPAAARHADITGGDEEAAPRMDHDQTLWTTPTAASGAPHQDSAGPPPAPLQALVADPLTAVQVSLMKDTTVWSRGLLATPPVVFAVLRGSQALLDRLAALALMASAAPALRGCFSGWAFEHIVVPLYGDTMYVFEAVDAMAAAAAAQLQLLAGGAASQAQVEAAAEAVAAAVEELHRRRLQIRNHVLRRRAAYHVGVVSAPEDLLPRMTNPDDALRVFSFMFALIQVANKATALARTISAHRRPSVGVLGRAYSVWWR
eukprot:XP_001699565.1 predicted protein [Chlamydomonas reinhardtii]